MIHSQIYRMILSHRYHPVPIASPTSNTSGILRRTYSMLIFSALSHANAVVIIPKQVDVSTRQAISCMADVITSGYTHVVYEDNDHVFLAYEEIGMTNTDSYRLLNAIPTGTEVKLECGTVVTPWRIVEEGIETY